MPLMSRTLRDDQALQACLVRDQAHVVPGSQGPHVARIQKALLLLDQSRIDPVDLRTKHYGPTTTAAVLAYKQKRRIINTAYQTSADNIVGKMTIARMDEELLTAERQNSSNVVCHDGAGGAQFTSSLAAPSSLASLRDGGSALVAPRQVLDVVFQRNESVQTGFEIRVLDLMARARQLMRPQGFDFPPGPPEFGPVVPHDELVHPGLSVDTFAVREASEKVLPGRDSTLRVIFCFFKLDTNAFGVTDGGKLTAASTPRKKFVLINILKKHADNGTLLHEIVHAAYKEPKFDHDGDPRSVFSEATSGRDHLPDKHAIVMRDAFFARGR